MTKFNHNSKTFLLALFFSSFLAVAAKATNWGESRTYYVKFHFTQVAWGKEIVGVYAHTGVLMKKPYSGSGGYYWESVKHVKLEKNNDHFYAKELLGASTGKEGPSIIGPVVQYWVYFKDGSNLVTRENGISSGAYESFEAGPKANEASERLKKQFEEVKDTQQTECSQLSVFHVS